jgi:hypothetical protein
VTISNYLYGAYGGNYESYPLPSPRRGSLFLSFLPNLSLLIQYALGLVSGEFNYTLIDIFLCEVELFAEWGSCFAEFLSFPYSRLAQSPDTLSLRPSTRGLSFE